MVSRVATDLENLVCLKEFEEPSESEGICINSQGVCANILKPRSEIPFQPRPKLKILILNMVWRSPNNFGVNARAYSSSGKSGDFRLSRR